MRPSQANTLPAGASTWTDISLGGGLIWYSGRQRWLPGNDPRAAARRGEVVEQPEQVARRRKRGHRRDVALVPVQSLRLRRRAVEHAARHAGNEEVATQQEARELVRLGAFNKIEEHAALVDHVGDALLHAERSRRSKLAQLPLGGRLAVQGRSKRLDLGLGEHTVNEAQAVFGEVLLRFLHVAGRLREAERDGRIKDRRWNVARLTMLGGHWAQLHDVVALSACSACRPTDQHTMHGGHGRFSRTLAIRIIPSVGCHRRRDRTHDPRRENRRRRRHRARRRHRLGNRSTRREDGRRRVVRDGESNASGHGAACARVLPRGGGRRDHHQHVRDLPARPRGRRLR